MGNSHTNISAAPVADADGYVVSVDMAVVAYILAATAPTFGARHVTLTRTVVNAADTPGTIVVVGKDLSGQTITETLIPGATGVLVTGSKFFASVSDITAPAGWVIGAVAADTIVIGWDAQNAVAVGSGTLHGIVVNTTAAGAIVIADSGGTIATIVASVAEGFVGPYDVAFSGFLRVEPAAASDITVIHSGSMPSTYAM